MFGLELSSQPNELSTVDDGTDLFDSLHSILPLVDFLLRLLISCFPV